MLASLHLEMLVFILDKCLTIYFIKNIYENNINFIIINFISIHNLNIGYLFYIFY